MSHTPGPWICSSRKLGLDEGPLFYVDSADCVVAEVCDEHDAQLIAAATEMLEALKNVDECITVDLRECTAAEGFDTKALKAAIAKAEGKNPCQTSP